MCNSRGAQPTGNQYLDFRPEGSSFNSRGAQPTGNQYLERVAELNL
ncbi:MAG: hypothetical protein HY774_27595 [Acidobacteria bacterium]|nr:hypothetical protein [Acidobacteriota bacterium]